MTTNALSGTSYYPTGSRTTVREHYRYTLALAPARFYHTFRLYVNVLTAPSLS